MTRIFSRRRKPVLEAIGQILILLSVITAIVYGAGWYPDGALVKPLVKGAVVSLLALFVLINVHTLNHFLLLLALTASVAGDVLLAIPGEQSFMRGLMGFLAAHVVFIILYLKNRQPMTEVSRARINIVAILWATAAIAFWLLYNQLGALLVPVVIYSSTLALMASTALLSRFSPRLVGAGAVFFVISDTLLGARQFMDVPDYTGYLVWGTYVLAQLLMTLGVMLAEDRRAGFGTYRFD